MKLPTPKYLFNKISENITKVTWTRQKLKLNKVKKNFNYNNYLLYVCQKH